MARVIHVAALVVGYSGAVGRTQKGRVLSSYLTHTNEEHVAPHIFCKSRPIFLEQTLSSECIPTPSR